MLPQCLFIFIDNGEPFYTYFISFRDKSPQSMAAITIKKLKSLNLIILFSCNKYNT